VYPKCTSRRGTHGRVLFPREPHVRFRLLLPLLNSRRIEFLNDLHAVMAEQDRYALNRDSG